RLQVRRDRPAKLLCRRQIGGGDLGDRAIHLGDRLLDDEVEQLLLAREVVVEAALEDADLLGDVADRGGMIPLGAEHLRRRRNDVVERRHYQVIPPVTLFRPPRAAVASSGCANSNWRTARANASLVARDPARARPS